MAALLSAQILAGKHIEFECCRFNDCKEPKFDLVLGASGFEDLSSNAALGPHRGAHDDTIESIFFAPPLMKITQAFWVLPAIVLKAPVAVATDHKE